MVDKRMEKLLTLQKRTFNITNTKKIKLKEQTLFKADGGEGLHLWEASVLLSRWVLKNKELFKGKTILELGSGCGLLGMSILKYTDCSSLVFSDYVDSVIENLKENIALNQDDENNSDESRKDWYNKALIEKIDWKNFESQITSYDIIIGTELIYQGGPIKELACMINKVLAKDGICYISMPLKRSMTDIFISYLKELDLEIKAEKIEDEDFYSISICEDLNESKLFEDMKKMDIMLYSITKCR